MLRCWQVRSCTPGSRSCGRDARADTIQPWLDSQPSKREIFVYVVNVWLVSTVWSEFRRTIDFSFESIMLRSSGNCCRHTGLLSYADKTRMHSPLHMLYSLQFPCIGVTFSYTNENTDSGMGVKFSVQEPIFQFFQFFFQVFLGEFFTIFTFLTVVLAIKASFHTVL